MSARWIAPALLALGTACLVAAWMLGPVRAAEDDSARTHRVIVCVKTVCEERGRTIGETACQVDAASLRLISDLPAGATIACKRVR